MGRRTGFNGAPPRAPKAHRCSSIGVVKQRADYSKTIPETGVTICVIHDRPLQANGVCKPCYASEWYERRRARLGVKRRHVRLPDNAELRSMLREHGTYASVARALGCSATAVGERMKKIGVKSPHRRGGPRSCDRCRITSEGRPILVFALSAGSTRLRGRGVGSMHLCEECWRETAGRRRHPERRRSKSTALTLVAA